MLYTYIFRGIIPYIHVSHSDFISCGLECIMNSRDTRFERHV